MAILQEVLTALGYQPGGGGGVSDSTKGIDTFDPVALYLANDSEEKSRVVISTDGVLDLFTMRPYPAYPTQRWAALNLYSPEDLDTYNSQYQIIFTTYGGDRILLAYSVMPFWSAPPSDSNGFVHIYSYDPENGFRLSSRVYRNSSLADLTGFAFEDLPDVCYSNFDIYDVSGGTLLQAATEVKTTSSTTSPEKHYRNADDEFQYWTDATKKDYSSTVTSWPVYVFSYQAYICMRCTGNLVYRGDGDYSERYFEDFWDKNFSVSYYDSGRTGLQFGNNSIELSGGQLLSNIPLEPMDSFETPDDTYVKEHLTAYNTGFSSPEGYSITIDNGIPQDLFDAYVQGYLCPCAFIWHNGFTVIRVISGFNKAERRVVFTTALPEAWRNVTGFSVTCAYYHPEMEVYDNQELVEYVIGHTSQYSRANRNAAHVYLWPTDSNFSLQISNCTNGITLSGIEDFDNAAPGYLDYYDDLLGLYLVFDTFLEDPFPITIPELNITNSIVSLSFNPTGEYPTSPYGYKFSIGTIGVDSSSLVTSSNASFDSTFFVSRNSSLSLEQCTLNPQASPDGTVFTIDGTSKVELFGVAADSIQRLYRNSGVLSIKEPQGSIVAADPSIGSGHVGIELAATPTNNIDVEVQNIKPHDGFCFMSDLAKPLWTRNGVVVDVTGMPVDYQGMS